MGKAAKSFIKPAINVAKNFTPVGQLAGIAKTAGLVKENPFDTVSNLLTGSKKGGGAIQGEDGLAELRNKAAEYEKALAEGRQQNLTANQELTAQLQQQARGQGPLAGAQLRAAQNRNLAQTLAAAQAGPQSALAARNLIQQRGQSSRDLAELGLQEQLQAQQALGSQIANQANILRGDVSTGFDIGASPARERIGMQRDKFAADFKREQANQALRNQILGNVASGATTAILSDETKKVPPRISGGLADSILYSEDESQGLDEKSQQGLKGLGGALADRAKEAFKNKSASTGAPVISEQKLVNDDFMSDESMKQAPNSKKSKLPSASKEVNSFLDALSARQYEYKDPTAPGAAPGERVGIVAQDLEKSKLGKTLVKDTPYGKMVDTVQGYGAILAAQAELNRRMKKLEKKG